MKEKTLTDGFTLMEVIVVVVIISSLGVLMAVAYPTTRSYQFLISAEQQLQSLLRESQLAALQEERDPECVGQVELRGGISSTCSDIGLVIDGSSYALFADTADPASNNFSDDDFVLTRGELTGGVKAVEEQVVFIFEVVFPEVRLIANGNQITDAFVVTLQHEDTARQYEVFPYGQIAVLEDRQ